MAKSSWSSWMALFSFLSFINFQCQVYILENLLLPFFFFNTTRISLLLLSLLAKVKY